MIQPRAARSHLGGRIHRTVLPSGLRVLTEAVPGSETFSVGFFVGVGSRHETPALHGVSHFLEHVLFKGTRTRSPEQISAAIEQVGGDLNAYTAREHTCFYARVLAKDAPTAVEVITDMLTDSLILEADVESEREVILDEIAMHADDPGEIAHEQAIARLLGRHPLGTTVIGSADSIAAMSREQIARFWRRHYHPEHIVVAAAGRVDHDALCAALASFERAGQATTPRRSEPPEQAAEPGLAWWHRNLDHCTSVLALPSPPIFDERRYPLGLLMMALGGGMSSRLFLDIRENRGLTYSIDASEGAWSDAGMLTVEWGCAPARLAEILGLVRQNFDAICQDGLSAAELDRVKGQMRGQTALAYESPASRMSRLGSGEVAGDRREVAEVLDRYDAVTGDEIMAIAQEFLTRAPVLSTVGPRTDRRRIRRILERW